MEQSGLSREEIREIVVSRPRREGETSVDRVRISNRLHGICDRVIVRLYNPDLIFVAKIIDIYYVGARDFRVIVERRCGCNILFYRTTVDNLHATDANFEYIGR